jgi:SET domain-containing protein
MSTSPTPNTLHIRITPITEPTHPAYCQYGLFAAKDLKSDSFIIFYLGLVHAQSDADLDSDYDLSFDRELGVGIDSAAMGNEARFINDYRGIDDAPNAEFREVWVAMGNGKSEKRMGVFVLSAGRSGKRAKGIGKGREILVSYGKGFWKERGAPE